MAHIREKIGLRAVCLISLFQRGFQTSGTFLNHILQFDISPAQDCLCFFKIGDIEGENKRAFGSRLNSEIIPLRRTVGVLEQVFHPV